MWRPLTFHSCAHSTTVYPVKLIMWFTDLRSAFLFVVIECRQIILNSMQTSLSSSGLVPDTTSVCWEVLVHCFSLALMRLSWVIMFDYLVVVVVSDLYSASRNASNALIVPLHRKIMSFQRRSEAIGTPSRVPEWVWKRVPFHRTRNGECPTTKCAVTVSWNHQLVTVGQSKVLMAWDIRCMHAAVHKVPRSLIQQTPVNGCYDCGIPWSGHSPCECL